MQKHKNELLFYMDDLQIEILIASRTSRIKSQTRLHWVD